MSNHRGTSYILRETQEIEERQCRRQIEQRISAMTETHQKAIHDLTSAHDQSGEPQGAASWHRQRREMGDLSVRAADSPPSELSGGGRASPSKEMGPSNGGPI
ncbi:hypothetical protein Scep_021795 [Stephania cephalantha]|uniref:Uncharacterized protein n=1 Tax=Stephania cephalantha TaxID=152367 RepID=A0AAP0F582_9MAGN